MKYMFVYFLVIASVCAQHNITLRNHSGTINKFPYQVGLLVRPYICGGSLISQTFIITAAHCIHSIPVKRITAYLGSIHFRRGIIRVPHSKIIHSEFIQTTLLNDIGLLKINAVNYSNNIKNIALPDMSSSNTSYEVEVVIASGWGRTSNTSGVSRIIQSAELLIISNSECSKAYSGRIIPESQICAASPSGASICEGDSGGPLVLKNSNILIGIISYAPTNSCTPHFGSAFTRVASYRQWIENNTGI